MADEKKLPDATDANFENDVLKSDQLTLVDFWAEWCGPCRLLGPTIETVAGKFSDKIKVFKMNVDDNPDTPAKFNIRGIPTVIFFKNGEVVDQMVGNQPEDAIVQLVEKNL